MNAVAPPRPAITALVSEVIDAIHARHIQPGSYPAPEGYRWRPNTMLRGEPSLVPADDYVGLDIHFRDTAGHTRTGWVKGQERRGGVCTRLMVQILPIDRDAPEWADLEPSQVIGVARRVAGGAAVVGDVPDGKPVECAA